MLCLDYSNLYKKNPALSNLLLQFSNLYRFKEDGNRQKHKTIDSKIDIIGLEPHNLKLRCFFIYFKFDFQKNIFFRICLPAYLNYGKTVIGVCFFPVGIIQIFLKVLSKRHLRVIIKITVLYYFYCHSIIRTNNKNDEAKKHITLNKKKSVPKGTLLGV